MTEKLLFINFLTLIRIIITIVIIPVYNLYGGFYVSLIVLIGYLTDSIDGILARHWHASTFFGAFFDVVADKTFTIMNFILLYLIAPYAIIPIIIEISIMIVQIIILKSSRKMAVKNMGKVKNTGRILSFKWGYLWTETESLLRSRFFPEMLMNRHP